MGAVNALILFICSSTHSYIYLLFYSLIYLFDYSFIHIRQIVDGQGHTGCGKKVDP